MADLYKNFAFCAAVSSFTNSATTVVVDDTSTLPSNTDLAGGDFFMVIESPLTHPDSFEIVKLTNVNTGTSTITISRGQDGTTGQAHGGGVLFKASLTAGMLTRLSQVANTQTRTTATATTSSLANLAVDSTTNITIAKSFMLLSISTSRLARVRLYETSAARTADLSRAPGTDPASTAGVILDYITSAASTTYPFSPLVLGSSLEGSPSSTISMTVQNLDSTGTVAVTFAYLKME